MWQHTHKWKRDHHGGGLQHPVIIDDVIYVEFKGLSLRKGTVVREDLLRMQDSDGSFPNPTGPGRPFGTAMAVLILEIPYRFLPIFQR